MLFRSLLLAALAAIVVSANEPKEIFLPPDCDVVTIVGKGFKLELSQSFDKVKKEWTETAENVAAIEGPRPADDESVRINTDSSTSSSAASTQSQEPMLMDEEISRWITIRATSLMDRVQRYQDELAVAKGGNRIVLSVLLLNSLVDLETIARQGIKKLKWMKNKIKSVASGEARSAVEQDVDQFVESKMKENGDIERATKGKNNPGVKWFTNTQAIRRILQEQRFSQSLGDRIVRYLSENFGLMKRSRVFEFSQPAKPVDDGLFYGKAKGHVPAHFPFVAQDAMANGAFV